MRSIYASQLRCAALRAGSVILFLFSGGGVNAHIIYRALKYAAMTPSRFARLRGCTPIGAHSFSLSRGWRGRADVRRTAYIIRAQRVIAAYCSARFLFCVRPPPSHAQTQTAQPARSAAQPYGCVAYMLRISAAVLSAFARGREVCWLHRPPHTALPRI